MANGVGTPRTPAGPYHVLRRRSTRRTAAQFANGGGGEHEDRDGAATMHGDSGSWGADLRAHGTLRAGAGQRWRRVRAWRAGRQRFSMVKPLAKRVKVTESVMRSAAQVSMAGRKLRTMISWVPSASTSVTVTRACSG